MNVKWTNPAAHDLRHIQDYVARENAVAAASLVQRIFEVTERQLSAFPNSGRTGRVIGTRELVISGTAYITCYRIRNGEVEVLAVIHGARRWPDRFP